MKYKQRKFFTSTSFEFLPNKLRYTFGNLSGSKQITIDYADISPEKSIVEERKSAYLYIGLIVFGVGSILGSYIYSVENRISGFNYAFIGLIFLISYFIEKRHFVLLLAGSDVIVILQNKITDQVLQEIDQRRKSRFLDILNRSEFANDKEKLHNFITTLIDNGIFSEQDIASEFKLSDNFKCKNENNDANGLH